MRRKIKQYLPALLLYLQRRVEGGRGAVVAVLSATYAAWIGGAAWLCTGS
jgi:hypothetical protein